MDSTLSFKVYNTDNVLFITREKIASRYLIEILGIDDCNVEVYADFSKTLCTSNFPSEERTKKALESFKEFEKVIKGTQKKDIVLLYRNPEKKVISGIVQDALNIFIQKSPAVFNELLIDRMMVNHDRIRINELLKNITKIGDIKIPNDKHPIVNFLKEFIYAFLKESSIVNFKTTHCVDFLYEYYYFIKSLEKYNLNLYIHDIDSSDIPLNKLLNSYNIETFKVDKSSHSNKSFNDYVLEIFEDNDELKTQFNSSISSEYFFYDVLKNSELNFKLK